MLRRSLFLLLAIALLQVAVPGAQAQGEARRKPLIRKGFEGPQLEVTSQGDLVMLWARPEEEGHRLYLARRSHDGGFGDPVEVASNPRLLPIDEARPALAAGPAGRVAVGWFDDAGRLLVNVSEDAGATFGAPMMVDPDGARVEHAFADLAFGDDGKLFAVWIDARTAPRNMEEPAHLYAARLGSRGVEKVVNLTSEFTESICGCCRPAIDVDRDRVRVLYRNVGSDGYRDIHMMETDLELVPRSPQRVGPATWKIGACPMAGAIFVGDTVAWKDGSKDRQRLVVGEGTDVALRPIADLGTSPTSSPRLVIGDDDLMLVPATPYGFLLQREGGRWNVVADDLPAWCHSVARVGEQLLLLGDDHGELEMEALSPTW